MQGMRCLMGWLFFVAFSIVGCRSPAHHETSSLDRIKKAGILTICLDPDNLPYSHAKKTPPGFDVEIGEQLAKGLGVQVKFVWVDSVHDTLLGDVIDEKCDCAVGSAIDERAADELENVGEKVAFTKAYYSTGYVLVVKDGGPQPKKLEELRGSKIGAEAGSVADYDLNLRHFSRRLYPRQEAIFNGLDTGEIAAGFMWAPNVGWMLKNDPKLKYKLVAGYVPEAGFRWNIGVAVRKEDKDLRLALDKIIEGLVETRQAEKIIAAYGVPYFPPFR